MDSSTLITGFIVGFICGAVVVFKMIYKIK